MRIIWKMFVASSALLLGACTSPHLVTDTSGQACHANYAQVKAEFGAHFARPCSEDLMASDNTLASKEWTQEQTLMANPHSFDDTHGIYTRESMDGHSQYYWMLPYPVFNAYGVSNGEQKLEARWHSRHPSAVRLFVYDAQQQDISNIQLTADGTTVFESVAIWPSEQVEGKGVRDVSQQNFDIPYAALKQMAMAHQAEITVSFVDGHSEQWVVVQQGEPSQASAGLRRLFNAIETR